MKHAKFTPGPWFVESDALDACYIAASHGQGNMPIASMFVDSGLHRANARLIAAAPELIEALTNLEMNARNASVFVPHVLLLEAIKQAQDAIANAMGVVLNE